MRPNPKASNPQPKCPSLFTRLAKWTSHTAGRPAAFMIALAVIVVWCATGPVFGYSDTWQLVINTGTTIVTFLMVFLIQATQNRDSAALHVKLDELIRAQKGARNALLDLESLTDEELEQLQKNFAGLANRTRKGPLGDRRETRGQPVPSGK